LLPINQNIIVKSPVKIDSSCQEKYLIKFASPCLTQPPKGYSVRYTYPNGKRESVGVESVKRDELIVSTSPSNDCQKIQHYFCKETRLWIVLMKHSVKMESTALLHY